MWLAAGVVYVGVALALDRRQRRDHRPNSANNMMIGIGTPINQSNMPRPIVPSYRHGLIRLWRSTFSS